MEALPGRDDSSRAVFGDDGGAGIFFAGVKAVAGVDFRFQFLAAEQDWGFECGRRAERCSA